MALAVGGRGARLTLAGGGSAVLLWAAAALVALVGVGAAPELRWRRWRWEVARGRGRHPARDVVVTRTLVPMLRVQHVDTRRGLLEQWLGLATVVFHTAAGANRIPRSTPPRPARVRDRIAELARHVDDEP